MIGVEYQHLGHSAKRKGAFDVCGVHPTPSTLSALCPQHISQADGGEPETCMKQQHSGPQTQTHVSPARVNGPQEIGED